MKKVVYLLLVVLMCSVVISGCTEKEVPQPVEDKEMIHTLIQDLRYLQERVYGEQRDLDRAMLEENRLKQEIARLQAILDKVIDYSVEVTDFQGNPIADADVTFPVQGALSTKKTNAQGIVTFPDMPMGYVTGTIIKEGFTSATYSASLWDDTETKDYAITRVALFPKSGTTGTISFGSQVLADLSDEDDSEKETLDVLKDLNIVAKLKLSGVPSFGGSSNAEVDEIAYDDAVWPAVWNGNTFTITLPAKSIWDEGFSFTIIYPDFLAEKTLINSSSTPAQSYKEMWLWKNDTGVTSMSTSDKLPGQAVPFSSVEYTGDKN